MPRRGASQRYLTTVLFTDIVGSTKRAAELGDRRWRQLLAKHNAAVRRELKRHGGRELDTTGDGFFARFNEPRRAIDCAVALNRSLRPLGIEIRAGINMGEVEAIGPKVGGIAVHVGSRVMSKAGPGEIWVSGTVRDLMAGSDLRFEDRGLHELKGVPGEWRLYSVQAPPVEEPPEEEEVETAPRGRSWLGKNPAAAVLMLVGFGAGLVVLPILASRDGGRDESTTPAPNTVVRIDPESGEVTAVASVGASPTAATYGLGSIWVANYTGRNVQRVDPATGEADQPLSLSASGHPLGITTGDGFVWATSSIDGLVYGIDPRTGGTRTFEVGIGAQGIAFAEGVIWVTNGQTNEVVRIDLATEQTTPILLEHDSQPTGIAVGGGSVWVAEHLKGRVQRIDPITLKPVEAVPLLRGQPDQVTFGQGFVWVSVGSDDLVLRIDPATRNATTIETVGNAPAGIGVGSSGAWVANSLDGTVAQIGTRGTKPLQRVPVGFRPQGVAVAPQGVWVTLTG
jgi:class 3 adenylate cyclase/streptogramin lyase